MLCMYIEIYYLKMYDNVYFTDCEFGVLWLQACTSKFAHLFVFPPSLSSFSLTFIHPCSGLTLL